MRPRFITIHSTANPKGDANAHSRYLNSGKSRSLNWPFTVDQFGAYQHIPTTETGHHADHSGPGDQYAVATVSYTHLDVYKRQQEERVMRMHPCDWGVWKTGPTCMPMPLSVSRMK